MSATTAMTPAVITVVLPRPRPELPAVGAGATATTDDPQDGQNEAPGRNTAPHAEQLPLITALPPHSIRTTDASGERPDEQIDPDRTTCTATFTGTRMR